MEVGHRLEKHVSDLLDHSVRLLPLVERVAEARVDGDDVVDVPKHLSDEILPSGLGDDIEFSEGLDPALNGLHVSTPATRHTLGYLHL